MSTILEKALRDLDHLPEGERARMVSMLADEVRRARQSAKPAKGHWAKVADRLAASNLLDGRSDDLMREVRAFRDGFAPGDQPRS